MSDKPLSQLMGFELDYLIGTKVMGWIRTPDEGEDAPGEWHDGAMKVVYPGGKYGRPLDTQRFDFQPSTRIEHAFWLAKEFADSLGAWLSLEQTGMWKWRAQIGDATPAEGDHPALAISRAVVLAAEKTPLPGR